MASCRTPWWARAPRAVFPFLWKEGPCGNFHPRRDRYCYCRLNEYHGDFHGGVWDFREGREVPLEITWRSP